MALPSKMFKLKEWLTVRDAARHLSIMFGEEVNEADVLHLALDGHLKLSVNLVKGTKAKIGRVVPREELVWEKIDLTGVSSEDLRAFYNVGFPEDHIVINKDVLDALPGRTVLLGGKRALKLGENVSCIVGLWDLPMDGEEKRYVEDAYQQLTGVSFPVEGYHGCAEGVFLERPDGEACELQDSFEGLFEAIETKNQLDPYYPAGHLPEDSILLVRTSALTDLMERLEKENEKVVSCKSTVKDDIGTKERGTWLKIIYLLADKLADSNKSAYLKADGSFNVSKFEDVLKNKAGDLLGTDDNINNSGHGLSNDNLKRIFDEAKTLF